MRVYSLEDGERLVRTARESIELYLTATKFDMKLFEQMAGHLQGHYGIFVTIRHYPLGEMRGAAGFTKATKPVRSLIIESAIAALSDERFVAVSHREIEHIVVEVSVLSHPTPLPKAIAKIKKEFSPGKEGIMIEYGYRHGIVLPEEAGRIGKMEQILEQAAVGAGLHPKEWRREDVRINKFSAQSFVETEPRGKAMEVKLEK
ncbi:MAG: AmmeMemoRadiSam system protein A [Candidatus Micrarchaeota archaeon]|nr:AmmeMemoRadiSam system protein A [Candidatus Micrarchaeota archaeon]MDE1846998.1 AmmeMemoRadiSam system protein A [Candidatus Micrarchaeota archaeon]